MTALPPSFSPTPPPKKPVALITGLVVTAVVMVLGGFALLVNASDPGVPVFESGATASEVVAVQGEPLPPYEVVPDSAVGMPAPYASTETASGVTGAVGGAGDTGQVLVFLAHWCPVCQREVPVLVQWNETGDDAGVSVVAVSTAVSPERPNYPPVQWLASERWPWPVVSDTADSDLFAAFGGTGFPYFVAITADGQVAMRAFGETDAAGFDELVAAAAGR